MKQQPGISEPPAMDYLDDSSVLSLMPTAICICDMAGIIRRYNERAAQLWGRRPRVGDANALFSGGYKLYHPDGTRLPHEHSPMAECLKDGLPVKEAELILERPDLSRIHIRVNVVPLVDGTGKQVGAINCFEDISQHLVKKTEELKKSEEQYHKMVEEVEDYAILMLDKDGTIMNWNKGAEKIKGYKEDEIVGRNFQEFYLPEDRDRGLPLQLLKLAKETGKALHEGWRKRKDGSVFWSSIVLTAIHNNEGRVIGFTKVTRDLTERKLAEDRLKDYLGQLEFQNRELEQFVYAASHDLKEPLRKFLLYNNYIADNPANQLDDKSREYLNRSLKAAERMKNLIEDLLMYSRATINIGKYEEVDLNKIIEEVILSHKEEIGEEKGKVIAEKLPIVRGVPFQLKQLFFNLINNSFKYKHPDRDVVIKINFELVNDEKVTAPNLERNRQYFKISVADNGIGFDQEYADRIFEIFQRLNNSANIKGSGIGLAICKKIVQNYKGSIEATGESGKGACFSVYFPRD
jgi:PAS domain S-box-containing protein